MRIVHTPHVCVWYENARRLQIPIIIYVKWSSKIDGWFDNRWLSMIINGVEYRTLWLNTSAMLYVPTIVIRREHETRKKQRILSPIQLCARGFAIA